MRRRNRRMKEKRKPFSPVSLGAAVTGLAGLALFFAFLAFSASRQGAAGRMTGALAFLGMLAAFFALFRGLSERRNENFDALMRWCGVILPAAAAACFATVYLLGAIIG